MAIEQHASEISNKIDTYKRIAFKVISVFLRVQQQLVFANLQTI